MLLGLLLTGACSNTPPEDEGDPDGQVAEGPHEDLDSLVWEPTFEPDYSDLQPQPWVEVATETQARTVVVQPDRLLFPKADNPEVFGWEAGKIIVSAPSDGPGANPLGFARRVVSVTEVDDTLVVETEAVALQDIVTGDMQLTFDYSNMNSVDLSKLDLEWAARNLYVDADVLSPTAAGNPDDESPPDLDENWEPVPPGDPFFGSIWSAIKSGVEAVGQALGGAARAVAAAAVDVWKAVTVDGFSSSVDIKPEIKNHYASDLFKLEYTKEFSEKNRVPLKLSIAGSGTAKVDYTFNPGVQVGVHIPPVFGDSDSTSMWLNVDSLSHLKLDLDAKLDAKVASAGGVTGKPLQDKLAKRTQFTEEVLAQAEKKYLGHPDMRPAGGWKRNILITKPATVTFLAGPVPVVLTQTIQVDLECGFEAKAGVKANVQFDHKATFKFSTRYEHGELHTDGPKFDARKNTKVTLTGAGSLALVCGLIPRVNVFVYDALGMNAGVRGSLVARAQYASRCAMKNAVNTPKADVTVGLYANLGVQVGGRIQPPGTSYLGSTGLGLGWDVGPIEVANKEFGLFEKTWTLDGLGYCSDQCGNNKRDGLETDVDCGGGACGTCAKSKACNLNSDCANGYCSAGRCSENNHCNDGVLDGDETGIDCGGTRCQPCGAKVGCFLPRDCKSGYCATAPESGSSFGRCVQNHCSSKVKDADESGIDCGGKDCPKCPVRARCAVESDCTTGTSDGTFCVPTTCEDRRKSGTETDVDCGGALCSRCGFGKQCNQNSDCRTEQDPFPLFCGPLREIKKCLFLLCKDGKRDGDETDIDCGGSCPSCAKGKACKQQSDCAAGLDCDPMTKTCVEDTCGAGQYAPSGVCIDVGIGYWSPPGSVKRNTCSNAPKNAEYTSPTASSMDCPWTCKPGYLRDPSGTTCEKNTTAQYLTCDAAEVAVGIHGRAGAWLDALGVRCARFDSGTIIGATRDAPAIGGSGGNAFSLSCASGEALYRVTGINGWAPGAPNQSWCSEVNLSSVKLWCKNLQTGKLTEREQAGGTSSSCTKPRAPEYSFDCGTSGLLRGLVVDSANTSTYVGYMLDLSCR